MKYLIVGLGNIGPEYAFTRHNAGFMVLDRLAAQEGLHFTQVRYGHTCEWKAKGRTMLLLKPNTYMNLSGKAVQYWMTQEKIPKENVLILVDDIALPLGVLRLKSKGSSAGHNGLKDMERIFGNNEYARLRIGIGDDFPKGRQIDYVLGQFSEDELAGLIPVLDKSKEAILSFCTIGIMQTMNSIN